MRFFNRGVQFKSIPVIDSSEMKPDEALEAKYNRLAEKLETHLRSQQKNISRSTKVNIQCVIQYARYISKHLAYPNYFRERIIENDKQKRAFEKQSTDYEKSKAQRDYAENKARRLRNKNMSLREQLDSTIENIQTQAASIIHILKTCKLYHIYDAIEKQQAAAPGLDRR